MKQNSRLFMISLILLSGVVLVAQAVVAQSPLEPQLQRRGDVFQDGRTENWASRTPISVILDDVEYLAGEAPSVEGGRIYVHTSEDQSKRVVRAFSSDYRAAEFMRLVMAKKGGDDYSGQDVTMTSCQHPYNYSYFNKNRFGGGSDHLFMDQDPGTSYPDRHLNLDFNGWNNTISYVEAACNGQWTVLYSCRNFQMFVGPSCETPDRHFVEPGLIVPDLLAVDFNNKTSSIRFE